MHHQAATPGGCGVRKRSRLAAAAADCAKISDLFPVVAAAASSAKRPRVPLQDCQGPPQHPEAPPLCCQQQFQQQQQQKDIGSGGSSSSNSNASTVPKLSQASASSASLTPQSLAVLRDFDLNWEYGPCVGISRLQRWERAAGRGLSPPPAVRSLVLAHPGDPLFTECVWLAYAGLV